MSNVRYQALGPLLSGEGSRAFLGLQIDEGRAKAVVLVWVPEAAASDAEATVRLAKETARAAALQHPNIIRVFGLAQVEEGLARVVEYADGETLRKVLDVAGTLPPRFAAVMAAEVAAGVHFAHLTGNEDGTPLVHGDIRPETVLVSFSGTCKVSGYGALSVAPKEMNGKRIKGRRAHSAPEQVLGGREAAIRETDVYLLGILLYECLTGMIPFGEEEDFDQAVVSQPLRLLNFDAIPAAMVDVIAKATAKRVTDRYPTALAFREAVERAAGGLPSAEELAQFLKGFFPQADKARAARRREIDAGIADFIKRRWEEQGKGPPSPEVLLEAAHQGEETGEVTEEDVLGALRDNGPPARSTPAPEADPVEPRRATRAPPAASPASRRPARPEARASVSKREPEPEEDALPAARGHWKPALIGAAAALVLAGGAWFAFGRRSNPPAPLAPRLAPVARALEVPAAPSPPEEEEEHAEPSAPAEPPPAKIASRPAKPAPPPVPAEPPSLELVVRPQVNVSIDGKPAGRSPLTVPLAPGRHELVLSDAASGIRLSRSVVVGAHGKVRQSISIGKGSVVVNAPDGAVISVDGKLIGKSPLGEFPVYEGSHRISVIQGKAKWHQAFSVRDTERMTFDVYTTGEQQ